MRNILYAYTTQANAKAGIDKCVANWNNLGLVYTFQHKDSCFYIGDSKRYHHEVDKESMLRYGGMPFVDVVFVPQEDSFDEDVVRYLKSRIRQVNDLT